MAAPSTLKPLRLLVALVLGTLALAAQAGSGLSISLPNGFATVEQDDLSLKSSAGDVRWMRQWNGREWQFNAQWESLSHNWRNLTGSQTADTTGGSGGTLGASGGSCWVWVDEDWAPAPPSNGVAAPLIPSRAALFNQKIGDPLSDYAAPMGVSLDYASLCVGSGGGQRNTEGIRRGNELYVGDNGRYSFDNRTILEKRLIRQLPTPDSASLDSQLASGRLSLSPGDAKGYRWLDKGGTWMDYNLHGQLVAWGDKNGNIVWLQRDSSGRLRAVIDGGQDAQGRVLYSLHYAGEQLSEVRDYPNGQSGDLPARKIQYQYDANNRLSQVTDPLGRTTRYDYDPLNHLVKITDPEGRSEQLSYNDDMVKQRIAADGGVTDYQFDYDDANKQFAGKISRPVTEAGRAIEDYTHNRVGQLVRKLVNGRIEEEIRRDAGARSETQTNARGFATRTTRNEFDQIVAIQYPDNSSKKFSYAAQHLGLTEETDEAGIKTQYQYDAKGNLIKRIEAAGTADERTTETTRDAQGRATRITRKGRTEANGTVSQDATWQIDYDPSGQVKSTTDPEGHVRQYQYNRLGQLIQATDPQGNTTRYETDASGRLTKITDALGRVRTFAYDKVGNLTTTTDAAGKAIRLAYDAMNRATQITNRAGGISRRQYDAEGQQTSETDEDGRTRRTEFDTFLRVTKEIDALGNATQYGFQTSGGQNGSLAAPTQATYPSYSSQTQYDARERPISLTLIKPTQQGQDELISRLGYDPRGLRKSDTDAYGKTRTYRYDAVRRLVEVTDTLGNKIQVLYDARDNLIQVTDAKGNTHRYEYDRNGRTVKETLPLGQVTRYSYDAAGNPKERIDPNGNRGTYTWDAANRLSEVRQYQGSGALTRITTYQHDAADNLIAWTDTDPTRNQTTRSQLTYDDAHRKTAETITWPDGTSYTYRYAYSPAGKKTQLTWPDGTAIGYGYSPHGQLETVTIPGEGTISVSQFKWTAPAKITLPGGSVQEKSYDGLLNLEGLKVRTPGQQTVLDLTNGYGKVQELKSRTRTESTSSGSATQSSTYTYDDETRLIQAQTDSASETFTLDAVANRIAHSQVSGAWSYDANSRLIRKGEGANATTYQYDEAGNLTKKTEPGNKTTTYAYDAQNRLSDVRDASNALMARYGYDPLNRRIWKEQYRDKDGNALNPGQRTLYLYADEGLIAEAVQAITLNGDGSVTANTAPQLSAQYGPKPDSRFTTGVLFVKTKNSNGQDVVAYYHHDHLKTPMQATDKAGNVVWSASYNAFGRAMITTPAATADKPTITSNLRLPGQYVDEETGLHYNFHRYYDPGSGRYITRDPTGLRAGINAYGYVAGDPVNGIDPLGLWRFRLWCGPDWTGGFNKEWGKLTDAEKKIADDRKIEGELDLACKKHDKCYAECRAEAAPCASGPSPGAERLVTCLIEKCDDVLAAEAAKVARTTDDKDERSAANQVVFAMTRSRFTPPPRVTEEERRYYDNLPPKADAFGFN